MKTLQKITALAACAFALVSFGAGEGATQKWVKKYVEEYVAKAVADGIANASAETAANAAATATLLNVGSSTSSNGVNVIETKVGDDGGTMRLEWEDATVYALMVTNATAASAEYGITNGFVFVWNGDGTYVNGNGEIVKTYPKSETNRQRLTWHDIDSVSTNGLEVFEGNFSVGGVMLQPSVAAQITNALTTASCRRSLWQTLGDLLMPSAMAQEAAGEADDASMWYTPEEKTSPYFEFLTYGRVYVQDGKGTKSYSVVYNLEKGKFFPSNLSEESSLEFYQMVDKNPAYKTALEALAQAYNAKNMVDTMAENLQKLFSVQGIEIKGKTPGGREYTQTYTISSGTLQKLFSGQSSGGLITAEKAQDKNIADENTTTWTKDNKIALYGANDALDPKFEVWGSDNFAIPCLKSGYAGLQWLRFGGYDKIIFSNKISDTVSTLSLANWYTSGPTAGFPDLATAMAREHHESTEGGYHVLVRSSGADKKLAYVNVGSLGAACDDVSVTTNAANGAVEAGKASVYGFAKAKNYDLPLKVYGEVAWKSLEDVADGKSLDATVKDDGIALQVKGADFYAGRVENHYFGTSQGAGASLGWWELPNVTTNMVVGDERTVVAGVQPPGATFADGTKAFGLLGWNYNYKETTPLVLINDHGWLSYIGADKLAGTNTCACPLKWEGLLDWTECGEVQEVAEVAEDGATNTVEKIVFPDGSESMTAFLKGRNFMYVAADTNAASAVSGEWSVGKDGVTAPTTAPGNWTDGETLGLTSNGAFQIAGFETADAKSACEEEIATQLASGANSHLFLAKHEKTGKFHYVHAGCLTNLAASVDGVTIATNEYGHDGQIAVKGAYETENAGKAVFSTGSGIEWKSIGAGVKVVGTDGSTNWSGAESGTNVPAQIVTFKSATNSNVKVWVTGTKSDATVTIGVYYK